MRMVKIIGVLLLAAWVGIQFFRPALNKSDKDDTMHMARIITVPGNVKRLLENACYDCHSNNTRYPWYVNMQPVAWFMSNHIKDGKAELNFDEFGTYPHRRQLSKLKAIAGSVEDETMPLFSYRLMHRQARLSSSEKAAIIQWALKTKDSLEASR